MSGVKKATVTNSLSKTMNMVRRALDECAERAEKVGNTGKKDLDRKRAEAEKIEVNRELPSDLREFLKGETAQWESLVRRYDEALKDAGRKYDDASGKLRKYESEKKNSDNEINSIQKKADAIRLLLSGKDWYCDFENEEAKSLRKKAEGVVQDMRGHANLCAEAQSISQKCFARYSESENLARLAQKEYDRLVNLGNDRKEKKRIREENERNAKCLAGDLRSLKERIESRNYRKFGGGSYSAAEQKQIDSIESLVSAGKYEQALKEAGDLKAKLAKAAETIENAQLAWETAKAEAEKTLADAKEEIAGLDRGEIAMYSGMDAGAVQAAFDEVEAAAEAIGTEDFAKAEATVAQGLRKIRAIAETTAKNKSDAENRLDIARCIMQVLYDADYDEPQAYLSDDDDQLSELHIVATAPGNIADMEMQIGLDGKVSFEVKNISSGEEQLCLNTVRALEQNLGKDGISFKMTDYGRAWHLVDAPPSGEAAIPAVKVKVKEPPVKTRMGSN